MRQSYMQALGADLVLRYNYIVPSPSSNERTTEEVEHRDINVAESFQNLSIIAAQKGNPIDQNIHMLQAELIRFLISQIQKKNKKLVSLIQKMTKGDKNNITDVSEE